jgi:hypothetical protein
VFKEEPFEAEEEEEEEEKMETGNDRRGAASRRTVFKEEVPLFTIFY